MKRIFKLFSLIMALVLAFGLVGCNKELTEEEKALLMERRVAVEQYMRRQTDFLWRAGESFTYTVNHGGSDNVVAIKEGELYLGLPYTYAGGTVDAFLEYSSNGADGVPVLNGLSSGALDGGTANSRLGNDCSSAVYLAWSQVSTSLTPSKSTSNMKYMNKNNGFLPLGDYECDDDNELTTNEICSNNGDEVLYNCYAMLQKGDVVMRRNSSAGHALMVVDVQVMYNPDGTVDPYSSSIVVLEQTFGNLKAGTLYFDEELNENVNVISGVDVSYSFTMLFNDKYVPITCKELIDPSSAPKEKIKDSVKKPSKENIFEGTITSNWFMDSIYVTITNAKGETVQKCAGRTPRFSQYSYDLSRFVNDNSNGFLGKIDLNALTSGTYSCKMDVKLTTGKIITVRDFTFNV